MANAHLSKDYKLTATQITKLDEQLKKQKKNPHTKKTPRLCIEPFLSRLHVQYLLCVQFIRRACRGRCEKKPLCTGDVFH